MSRVTVIGAGVVGLTAAIALRHEGHDVSIVDRLPPGEACSFGNSGAMPRYQALPLATPGILWKVPGYLSDPLGPLALRMRYFPHLVPWLIRFLWASNRASFSKIVNALLPLLKQSFDDWTELIARAHLHSWIQDSRSLSLYRTPEAREHSWAIWRMLIAQGARAERVDTADLRAMEPAAPAGYPYAILDPDYRRAVDPYRLCVALAEYFQTIGGRIERAHVAEILLADSTAKSLRTNKEEFPFDRLVIAAGAWSNELTRKLGDNVPLESARGYHVTLLESGIEPQHVLLISDMRMSLTPMRMGLRLGGSIEFAGLYAAPNFDRPAGQLRKLSRIYPTLRTERHTKWAGDRPLLPDSLPIICRSPRFHNVVYAFGHGQYGLALAAATARVVADLVGEREPSVKIEPFRVDRF